MAKKLLAAGYVRDIEFGTPDALQFYLCCLGSRKVTYKMLERFDREDGSIIVRILQQYNNAPLIQLYDNL